MKLICICDKWEGEGKYPAPKYGEECIVTSKIETGAGCKYFTLLGYPKDIAYGQENFVQIDTGIVEVLEEKELAA